MTRPLQRSPSTGCTTSRSCRGSWLRIQTPSSALNRPTLSTGGRRASRAAMETRHLSCWSPCLNVEVGLLFASRSVEKNASVAFYLTKKWLLTLGFVIKCPLPIIVDTIIRPVTLPDGSVAEWWAPHLFWTCNIPILSTPELSQH